MPCMRYPYSFVIGYLMHHKRMSFRDGLAHARRLRSIVSPNRGFLRQLGKPTIEMRSFVTC